MIRSPPKDKGGGRKITTFFPKSGAHPPPNIVDQGPSSRPTLEDIRPILNSEMDVDATTDGPVSIDDPGKKVEEQPRPESMHGQMEPSPKSYSEMLQDSDLMSRTPRIRREEMRLEGADYITNLMSRPTTLVPPSVVVSSPGQLDGTPQAHLQDEQSNNESEWSKVGKRGRVVSGTNDPPAKRASPSGEPKSNDNQTTPKSGFLVGGTWIDSASEPLSEQRAGGSIKVAASVPQKAPMEEQFPYMLRVFSGSEAQDPLSFEDWIEVEASLSVQITRMAIQKGPIDPQNCTALFTKYKTGHGIIACENMKSQAFFKELISRASFEGRRFRAWDLKEDVPHIYYIHVPAKWRELTNEEVIQGILTFAPDLKTGKIEIMEADIKQDNGDRDIKVNMNTQFMNALYRHRNAINIGTGSLVFSKYSRILTPRPTVGEKRPAQSKEPQKTQNGDEPTTTETETPIKKRNRGYRSRSRRPIPPQEPKDNGTTKSTPSGAGSISNGK